jgi:vacuolar protein sorting-associated protein 13A/C
MAPTKMSVMLHISVSVDICFCSLSLKLVILEMQGSEAVVLLTKSRVLAIYPRKSVVIWDLPFSRISGVQIEDTGVRFADKAGKGHDKFVGCSDKDTQGWFFNAVAQVVKAYNAQRRIER